MWEETYLGYLEPLDTPIGVSFGECFFHLLRERLEVIQTCQKEPSPKRNMGISQFSPVSISSLLIKPAWCKSSYLYSLLVDRNILSRLFFLTGIWHFTDAMFFTPGPKYGISIWLQNVLASLNMNMDVELNIKDTVKIYYIVDNSGFLKMFSTCKKLYMLI